MNEKNRKPKHFYFGQNYTVCSGCVRHFAADKIQDCFLSFFFYFLLVFVAGRRHAGCGRHVWRIDCSRFAPRHDGVHENNLRAAPDPPERFQKNLGRKYHREPYSTRKSVFDVTPTKRPNDSLFSPTFNPLSHPRSVLLPVKPKIKVNVKFSF